MFFYEDFLKKIDGNIKGNGVEKFGLEAKKGMMWLGTGIPFMVIGVLELYISYNKNFSINDLAIGIIFLILSLRHLKLFFSYKIILDFNERKLKNKDIVFEFDNVKSCTMREQTLGKKKRLEVVIDVITKDGQQILIPLMMNKKVRFVSLLKNELGKRFIIEK